MSYDDEEYEEEEETTRSHAMVSSYAYPSGGLLSRRFVLALVCLTFIFILCAVAGWQLWGQLSRLFTSITSALSDLFNGFGQVAHLIGFVLGLALAAVPVIVVAWLAAHAYVAVKGRSIRNRTFAVDPTVNNFAALLDERTGTFIQPEAGELPQTVPAVPQTYSPHIVY